VTSTPGVVVADVANGLFDEARKPDAQVLGKVVLDLATSVLRSCSGKQALEMLLIREDGAIVHGRWAKASMASFTRDETLFSSAVAFDVAFLKSSSESRLEYALAIAVGWARGRS